ncbi:uncharacterized protein LOC121428176 [Lytechinus variegatus]|uniref:uncharacterized protein LOC121428176 n=1 Tax=Lytechinus variegatus TaxID=7654 RepID=UPI001BB14A90|nr:uncharacterized protein LOC121428176 [Lytechinus variegatus]
MRHMDTAAGYEKTTNSVDEEYDFEKQNGCREKVFNVISHVSGITAAVSIVLMITTLLVIALHPSLRKKQNIFPFNIILADCVLCLHIFVNYSLWASGSPFHNCLSCLRASPFVASQMVSAGSIFLVALEQLTVFRLDPFGVKNILTKCRRIFICVLTWVLMIGIAICVTTVFPDPMLPNARFYFCNVSIVLTGIFYFLVYRAIVGARFDGNSRIQRQRNRNKRILRTYALVLGTTLILATCPDCYCFIVYYISLQSVPSCVTIVWVFMIAMNSLANTLIYWWRLSEFREIFSCSTVKSTSTGDTLAVESNGKCSVPNILAM